VDTVFVLLNVSSLVSERVHSPVGHASDAYTLQQRLSSEQRRLSDSYEIDYNDSVSQYGKFDNKGFARDGRY
jgi:hypothetical protein